jgi:hypothetical protein
MPSFDALFRSIGGKHGIFDVSCPLCGPLRQSPGNRVRRVLRVWYTAPGFIGFCCARCGEEGFARDRAAPRTNAVTRTRVQTEIEQHARAAAADQLKKAVWLWRSRQPLRGTIAERYLRDARAYGGPLPPTLGFLQARGEYPPAMIAAFGIPDEPEPHTLVLPDANVRGVHLTRLARDGSDRDRSEKAKIMIGHSKGCPIVLSPPTDGLGLAIAEGIESSLSAFEATGLCTWAAGSSSRLLALADAIPNWVESVTILADDDVDGRRHAVSLAQAVKERGLEVRLRVFGQREDSAA